MKKIILKTAVEARKKVQDFELQTVTNAGDIPHVVKDPALVRVCSSKGCALFPHSTAVFRIIAGICIIAVIFGIERLHSYHNGRFRISKILSPHSQISQAPPKEVDALLNQKFRFLGKGCTSFVFLGDDGKTVLKLFNHSHLLFESPLFRISLPGVTDSLRICKLYEKKCKTARKQQNFFFSSCRLSYEKLKEETGLIYLSLQPNAHFTYPLTLIDAWGIRHTIDLSHTEFALQKKAEGFLHHLEHLKKEGRHEEIQNAMDAYIANIVHRCHLGIADWDPNVQINFGWIGGKVVEFDIGGFYYKPCLTNPGQTARELFFSSRGLQQWLHEHCPEQLDYFIDAIRKTGLAHFTD